MQTFVPHGPDFSASAECLDRSRLIKQLLECRQIMNILAGQSKAWANHPAVLMWKYHEDHLLYYTRAIVQEMIRRGYKWEDNWAVTLDTYMRYLEPGQRVGTSEPAWLSDSRVSESHQASLYRKAPDLYPQLSQAVLTSCHPTPYTRVDPKGRKVKTKQCDYFWPTHVKEYSE